MFPVSYNSYRKTVVDVGYVIGKTFTFDWYHLNEKKHILQDQINSQYPKLAPNRNSETRL